MVGIGSFLMLLVFIVIGWWDSLVEWCSVCVMLMLCRVVVNWLLISRVSLV